MGSRLADGAAGSSMKRKISAGNVGLTGASTAPKTTCGGAVEKWGKTAQAASSQSMRRKKMKTTKTSKKQPKKTRTCS